MAALTDDEAITLALLHGCEFWQSPRRRLYYSCGPESSEHEEFEEWCRDYNQVSSLAGYETQAQLAHKYCEFYKLGVHKVSP